MLTIIISQKHTRFNLWAITNSEYIHLEFMLLHLDQLVLCVHKKKQRSDYSRSRHDAIANTFTTSDVLANSSVSLEVNYKIVKKKPKIEEKIPMWTRGLSVWMKSKLRAGVYKCQLGAALNWATPEIIQCFGKRIECDQATYYSQKLIFSLFEMP